MALYKPNGDGPFPGLVLMHQCGGMTNNQSMLDWSRKAVNRGYVVLQVDALTQRGARSLCQGPQNKIFPSRGVRDALMAAAHLRSLPYVDKNQVAFAGFSWGGGVGLMAASKMSVRKLGVYERFNAVASNYPPCVFFPKNGDPYSAVLSDIDTPLLVLLGGKDNETPPELCTERLEPKIKAGEPVTEHTYPDGYHCWDCKQWDGKSKTDIRGHMVNYIFDVAITKDSEDRMFNFFETSFKKPK
jgi:dienelactone hydrolase